MTNVQVFIMTFVIQPSVATAIVLASAYGARVASRVHQKRKKGYVEEYIAKRWFFGVIAAFVAMFLGIAIYNLLVLAARHR